MAASTGDPLQSAGCREALAELHDREADAASAAAVAGPAARRPDAKADPRLVASRHRAAVACLATRADPPTRSPASSTPAGPPAAAPPGRLAQSPVVVPPVAGTVPAGPTGLPPLRTTLPPPAPTGPRFITSCDAGGCWADDGSRLDRVGPNLWNRRGACSVQGSVVTCP